GGMHNVQYGDADSLGYLQMRTSVWSGQYPDFQHHPEQQLKWFIDEALSAKHQLSAQAQHDPSQYGNWIADIERPAAQYRRRCRRARASRCREPPSMSCARSSSAQPSWTAATCRTSGAAATTPACTTSSPPAPSTARAPCPRSSASIPASPPPTRAGAWRGR